MTATNHDGHMEDYDGQTMTATTTSVQKVNQRHGQRVVRNNT